MLAVEKDRDFSQLKIKCIAGHSLPSVLLQQLETRKIE